MNNEKLIKLFCIHVSCVQLYGMSSWTLWLHPKTKLNKKLLILWPFLCTLWFFNIIIEVLLSMQYKAMDRYYYSHTYFPFNSVCYYLNQQFILFKQLILFHTFVDFSSFILFYKIL